MSSSNLIKSISRGLLNGLNYRSYSSGVNSKLSPMVILGGGNLPTSVLTRLKEKAPNELEKVTVVDPNLDALEKLHKMGIDAYDDVSKVPELQPGSKAPPFMFVTAVKPKYTVDLIPTLRSLWQTPCFGITSVQSAPLAPTFKEVSGIEAVNYMTTVGEKGLTGVAYSKKDSPLTESALTLAQLTSDQVFETSHFPDIFGFTAKVGGLPSTFQRLFLMPAVQFEMNLHASAGSPIPVEKAFLYARNAILEEGETGMGAEAIKDTFDTLTRHGLAEKEDPESLKNLIAAGVKIQAGNDSIDSVEASRELAAIVECEGGTTEQIAKFNKENKVAWQVSEALEVTYIYQNLARQQGVTTGVIKPDLSTVSELITRAVNEGTIQAEKLHLQVTNEILDKNC